MQVATLGAQVPPRDVWALVRRPTWIARATIFTLLRDSLLVVLLFAAGSLLIGDLLGGAQAQAADIRAIAVAGGGGVTPARR